MRRPLEIQIVRDQDFAAPDAAVRAIASAIHCESDNPSFQMILGHATGDMRVMVLNAYGLRFGLRESPTSGEIIWMKVIRDDGRPNFEDILKMIDRFLEEFVSLCVFEVANVLAQKCLVSLQHTNGAFQFSAHCKRGREFFLQKYGYGNKAAGTSQLPDLSPNMTNHRIVAAAQDLSVVHQKVIGQGC